MRRVFRLLLVVPLMAFSIGCCAIRGGCNSGENAAIPPPECAFQKENLRIGGHDWPVYSIGGEGPPVLIAHEMDGLSRGCLMLAKELAESPAKHRVYLPLLFGKWNADAANKHLLGFVCGRAWGKRWQLREPDSLGSIIDEAAVLCREISARRGGQRVTVIGSCLTGSWPVALLREPFVAGGILCQPALPMLPTSDEAKSGLGLTGIELEASVAAAKRENKSLLGFCYLEDQFTPEAMLAKFERLENAFGDRFTPCILASRDDRDRVPEWAMWIEGSETRGHSTLTKNVGMKSSVERNALLQRAMAFIGARE